MKDIMTKEGIKQEARARVATCYTLANRSRILWGQSLRLLPLTSEEKDGGSEWNVFWSLPGHTGTVRTQEVPAPELILTPFVFLSCFFPLQSLPFLAQWPVGAFKVHFCPPITWKRRVKKQRLCPSRSFVVVVVLTSDHLQRKERDQRRYSNTTVPKLISFSKSASREIPWPRVWQMVFSKDGYTSLFPIPCVHLTM